MMMGNLAIGLAAATIAIGGSTLSGSALYGQESGISNKSMSESLKSDRLSQLTPMQREHLRGKLREGYAELTPMQRERLRGKVHERLSQLTPTEREHLRGKLHERLSQLTPTEREHLRGKLRERYEQLTPLQRERLYRHGPFGSR
jgi:hypothetical protein